MSEDDPTKDLPKEDAPTADPLPAPDTAPMLEKILAEAYKTRDILMAELSAVKTELQEFRAETSQAFRKAAKKVDDLNNQLLDMRVNLQETNERVDKLEGDRA